MGQGGAPAYLAPRGWGEGEQWERQRDGAGDLWRLGGWRVFLLGAISFVFFLFRRWATTARKSMMGLRDCEYMCLCVSMYLCVFKNIAKWNLYETELSLHDVILLLFDCMHENNRYSVHNAHTKHRPVLHLSYTYSLSSPHTLLSFYCLHLTYYEFRASSFSISLPLSFSHMSLFSLFYKNRGMKSSQMVAQA